jgi:hypothetical protein
VSKKKRPGKNSKMPADKDSLLDGLSIGWGRLCVNKKSVARYGQELSGQKSISCGAYYRKKTADYVSAVLFQPRVDCK